MKVIIYVYISILSVYNSFATEYEVIKLKENSPLAACKYMDKKYKIKSYMTKNRYKRKGQKDLYFTIGYTDRLFTKDFPLDINAIKTIAFMNCFRTFYAESISLQRKKQEPVQYKCSKVESLSDGFEFELFYIMKQVSKYQSNCIEYGYSLRQNGKLVFSYSDRTGKKAVFVNNFSNKNFDEIVKLMEKISKVKFHIDAVLYNEPKSRFRKSSIRDLVVVTIFDVE